MGNKSVNSSSWRFKEQIAYANIGMGCLKLPQEQDCIPSQQIMLDAFHAYYFQDDGLFSIPYTLPISSNVLKAEKHNFDESMKGSTFLANSITKEIWSINDSYLQCYSLKGMLLFKMRNHTGFLNFNHMTDFYLSKRPEFTLKRTIPGIVEIVRIKKIGRRYVKDNLGRVQTLGFKDIWIDSIPSKNGAFYLVESNSSKAIITIYNIRPIRQLIRRIIESDDRILGISSKRTQILISFYSSISVIGLSQRKVKTIRVKGGSVPIAFHKNDEESTNPILTTINCSTRLTIIEFESVMDLSNFEVQQIIRGGDGMIYCLLKTQQIYILYSLNEMKAKLTWRREQHMVLHPIYKNGNIITIPNFHTYETFLSVQFNPLVNSLDFDTFGFFKKLTRGFMKRYLDSSNLPYSNFIYIPGRRIYDSSIYKDANKDSSEFAELYSNLVLLELDVIHQTFKLYQTELHNELDMRIIMEDSFKDEFYAEDSNGRVWRASRKEEQIYPVNGMFAPQWRNSLIWNRFALKQESEGVSLWEIDQYEIKKLFVIVEFGEEWAFQLLLDHDKLDQTEERENKITKACFLLVSFIDVSHIISVDLLDPLLPVKSHLTPSFTYTSRLSFKKCQIITPKGSISFFDEERIIEIRGDHVSLNLSIIPIKSKIKITDKIYAYERQKRRLSYVKFFGSESLLALDDNSQIRFCFWSKLRKLKPLIRKADENSVYELAEFATKYRVIAIDFFERQLNISFYLFQFHKFDTLKCYLRNIRPPLLEQNWRIALRGNKGRALPEIEGMNDIKIKELFEPLQKLYLDK